MVPARQKVPGMVPVTVLNLFLHACPMGFSAVNANFQIFDQFDAFKCYPPDT